MSLEQLVNGGLVSVVRELSGIPAKEIAFVLLGVIVLWAIYLWISSYKGVRRW